MSFEMSGRYDPKSPLGNFQLHSVTLLDWKLRPMKGNCILWEVHFRDCTCSHCQTAKTSWPLFIWFPHWKYFFGNGWTTIGLKLQGKVHYLRLN